jgi:uncharacterized protein YjbJ (UPF0337 family)
MNSDMFKGKYKEISGDIKKKWGELTEDELQRTKGNMESLTGLLQQKFGIAKEKASQELSEIFNRHKEEASDKVNSKIDSAKAKLS